jgi:hypothetical protein
VVRNWTAHLALFSFFCAVFVVFGVFAIFADLAPPSVKQIVQRGEHTFNAVVEQAYPGVALVAKDSAQLTGLVTMVNACDVLTVDALFERQGLAANGARVVLRIQGA